jgi:hypothetical protein
MKLYDKKLAACFKRIKQRCNNPGATGYKNYGGRGIKCLWESLSDFRNDMRDSFIEFAEKYEGRNISIERIDNNGHYSKENCKWATLREQANNRRSNRLLNFLGKTQNVGAWSKELKISSYTILNRLNLGWSVDDSLSKPIEEKKRNSRKKIRLYDIPRGSRIKAETTNGDGKKLGDFIIFHKLDGMFSYCTIEGTEEVCHLAATQELKLSDEGYYELA